MNLFLVCGGVLAALLGIAHSVLGEKLVLGPLFRRGALPKLLGSSTFARRTLRFTWHLTTVLLIGVSAVIIVLGFTVLQPQSQWTLRVLALTLAAGSLVSLIGARARHFSWWVLLIVAVLVWIGAQ